MENNLGSVWLPKLAFLLFVISFLALDLEVTGKSYLGLFSCALLSFVDGEKNGFGERLAGWP